MMATAANTNTDIILVSEPNRKLGEQLDSWYIDVGGRAAIAITGNVSIEVIGPPELGFCWLQIQGIRVYSCYWSPNLARTEYSDFLSRLEFSVRGSKVPTLVAGDFNAHSPTWGSNFEDTEGRMVNDTMSSLDLHLCNHGEAPTFTRGLSASHIDLTFATKDLFNRLHDLSVLNEETLSLHHYISFNIKNESLRNYSAETPNISKYAKWSWRKLDSTKLQEYLDSTSAIPTDTAISVANDLTRLLEEACNECMPKGSYKGRKKPAYWWTQEIATLRKQCLRARRGLKRTRRKDGDNRNGAEYEEYKEARKKLKTEIMRSKKRSWESLCKQVDNDPWGLPFRLVTKKLVGRNPIPGLTLPNRLDTIVNSLFPSQRRTNYLNIQLTEPFPEITCAEILNSSKLIPVGKAPGPDGVPDFIIKRLAISRPEILSNVFNTCIREGVFPENWKISKLVLLREGTKPLETPSSYRPICLLNTVGKFFEKIIKGRLEAHLEQNSGLNDLQFGFRKEKSTVDAVSKVMDLVNAAGTDPLRRRKLCVLVALDVSNAFNSARWDKIEKALWCRNVPIYLIGIIRSYLSNRLLLYGDKASKEITCGVPQGSVLGPTLWNIMYDDLLKVDLTGNKSWLSSSTLIAFADDVAIVATGSDTQMLEETTNEALSSVAEWMEENGLKLSASKTEAVMLTSKRGYSAPSFILNGERITPKDHLRYLGVELCKTLGFKKHIQTVVEKTVKTANALSKILPNVRGSKQRTRQLLASVVNSQLLYAAPVWESALEFNTNKTLLQRPQRTIALRVASAYRTISTPAIFVIAEIIPVHLIARERKEKRARRVEGTTTPDKIREIILQRWQEEWNTANEGRWTWRLIRDIKRWFLRKHGYTDYHLTQMFSGHGYFGHYLHRFKKRESPKCVDCDEEFDSAEHTLFQCGRWWRQRRELEVVLHADMTPESIVGTMLEDKKKWDAVKEYVKIVLSTKEEEERRIQQQNTIN